MQLWWSFGIISAIFWHTLYTTTKQHRIKITYVLFLIILSISLAIWVGKPWIWTRLFLIVSFSSNFSSSSLWSKVFCLSFASKSSCEENDDVLVINESMGKKAVELNTCFTSNISANIIKFLFLKTRYC